MAYVLTVQSDLRCTYQGKVQLTSSQNKLKVGGAAVLVDGDLSGASISGCPILTNPNTGALICSTVSTTVAGVATKLKVGGKGVLLDTIQGQTNGTVGGNPQMWSVSSAGQSKLQTG